MHNIFFYGADNILEFPREHQCMELREPEPFHHLVLQGLPGLVLSPFFFLSLHLYQSASQAVINKMPNEFILNWKNRNPLHQ